MATLERSWLPAGVAEAALASEPELFHKIVQALVHQWKASEERAGSDRVLSTFPWISYLSNCHFVIHKEDIDPADVDLAVLTILDIILHPAACLATKTRWSKVLHSLLWRMRRKVSVVIPWRPLYENLQSAYLGPRDFYEGIMILEGFKMEWTKLIQRSRRFFAPGTAQEIWEEFGSRAQNIHKADCFEALGWLSMLMPTHHASSLDGEWDAWVPVWLDLWESVTNISVWDTLFLDLFARLAKRDTRGAVNWAPHLDRLATHVLAAFQVPVGTASATSPVLRSSPIILTFLSKTKKSAAYAAKLVVYLLERQTNGAPDLMLAHLASLADLLEQYYHPSNTGSWTPGLAEFLQQSVKHFTKRLVFENSPDGAKKVEPNARPVVGIPVSEPRGDVSADTQRRVSAIVLQLANKAMYSKDNTLLSNAGWALAQLAYVQPDMVLRLVTERFQGALEMVTATHQLVSSIYALGLCTRPLLLAGLPPDPALGQEGGPSREAAGQAIATAIMEMLPAIDVNDSAKTMVAMQFYMVVLSSVASLEGGPGCLPFNIEVWMDELLSRVFAILGHLEAPDVREQRVESGSASFLMEEKSMFRPMMELLFGLLPSELRKSAVRQVARFVLGNVLPSVTHEASLLCKSAAWADPDTAARHLAEPLLARVESELASAHSAMSTSTTGELSKVLEASINWYLSLLFDTLFRMGPAVLPFRARLIKVLDAVFRLPSKTMQELASDALNTLINGLLDCYPTDQYAPWATALPGQAAEGEAVLAPWLDQREAATAAVCPSPKWHIATAEEVAFARELVDAHLGTALTQLQAFCRDRSLPSGARDEKEGLRGILSRIIGVVCGARACLPDFTLPLGAQVDRPDSLRMVGNAGPEVGSSALRDATAAALRAAIPCTQDPDLLIMLIRVINEVLSYGAHEHTEFLENLVAWKADERYVTEPPVANLRYPQEGAEAWRRRRPRWLVVEHVHMFYMWRISQRAYRATASASVPLPTLATTPQPVKDLVEEMAVLCLHPYEGVRNHASHCLDDALKRYYCLAPVVLPRMLCALAGIPAPPTNLSELPPDALDDGGVSAGLLKALLQAGRRNCLGSAGPKLPLSPAEASAEEGRVSGAVKALCGHSLWRLRCRQPSPMAAFAAALLSSLGNRSTKAGEKTTELFQREALKFVRPAALLPSQCKDSGYPPGIQSLFDELLSLIDAQEGQAHLNWRNAMFVNGTLLFLFPPLDPATAGRMTGQAVRMLCQQLAGQRIYGMLLLKNVLAPDEDVKWRREDVAVATRSAVKAVLSATPDFGKQLAAQMAHSHPLQTDVRGIFARFKSMNVDERTAEMVSRTIGAQSDFLMGRPMPEAIQDNSFIPRHAGNISVLTQAAPTEMLGMMRPVLEDLLEGKQQDEDRPSTFAACEIIAGLLRSGVCFESQGPADAPSAWQEWLQRLLQSALLATPFDLADVWAVALRYTLHGLGNQDSPHFGTVLNLIAEPLPQGAQSSALVKRLKLVRQALAEVSALGVTGSLRHPTTNVGKAGRAFQRKILAELPSLMAIPADLVREQAAIVSVILLGSLLWEQSDASTRLGTPLKAHPLSEDEFSAVDSSSGGSSPMEVETADPDALLVLASGGKSLRQAAEEFQASFIPAMEEGVATVLSGPKVDAAGAEGPRPHDPAVAQLGFALHIVRQAIDSENGVALPTMHTTLLRMLPAMLKVQEITEPALQPLAHEAKAATALLKYVPVSRSMLPAVTSSLQEAAAFNLWATRGAALTFVQYFWFRHSFLLGPPESHALQKLVVAGLADAKAEVQEVAAATLSGLLKGLPATEAETIRSDLLKRHAELFPARRRKKATATAGGKAAAEADTSAKHAVVMGLKACVLSAPYDIPSWLPQVLIAVVRSASEPPPIRNTARKAVAEFRRTHEEAELAEARNLLSQDQWEALLDVVSPASYFA